MTGAESETATSRGGMDVDAVERVQSAIAAANKEAGTAVYQGANLASVRHPDMTLANAHAALLNTLQETIRAIEVVEKCIEDIEGDYGEPTPRQIKNEHADRLEERYDGPVLNLALMLCERNRREWLHEKPSTNGAEDIKRHGLTANQRTWLNELSDAWREYDGE